MAPIAGFNWRVRINGVLYSVSEGSVDDETDPVDITNTEGRVGGPGGLVAGGGLPPGLFRSVTGSPVGAKIMLKKASFDPAENPFAAPLRLRAFTFVAVLINPGGINGPPWNFPSAMITRVRHEMQVRGAQPVTIELESDGAYSTPTGIQPAARQFPNVAGVAG